MNIFPSALGLCLGRVLIAAVLAASCCFAIDPHRAMSQYVRDRWGTEQGFPRGAVYAIAQTTDGYLWIGTGAGLVRFDGLQFVMVRDPSRKFIFTSVIGLAAANDGSLWLRLRDLTLLRYRGGEFSIPSGQFGDGSEISALARTGAGQVIAAKMQLGAFSLSGTSLKLIAPATGVPRSPVIAVALTGDGTAWLGTRGAGLFQLKGGATNPIKLDLPDPKINCLLPDGADVLWVGTDNGLARWDGAQLTTRNLPAAVTRAQILALAKDRDSNIWVGADSGGLLRFNSEGAVPLSPGKGESSKAVTAVFEDREGSLWFGSADGIERLRDSPFITYSAPEGLPGGSNGPIFVDSQNRTWFTSGGGLWWLKNGESGRINESGLRNDIVYSIAGTQIAGGQITGAMNDLWVGRRRGGLTRLRSEQGVFSAKTYTTLDGLAQNSVYSVYVARSGGVWAGTLSGGVSKLDHGAFTTYTAAAGLASNTVASILESADGAMWFATPGGLSSFAKDRWQTFTAAQGLPSENINCLLQDSTGTLWAGTMAGLAFRNAVRFVIPAHAPAAIREPILGLTDDAYGFLWIATSNHVLRINRDKLVRGTLAPGDFREFGIADGLRGTEGIKRQRSVAADSLGRIWMSLNRGLSVADPARLSSSSVSAIPQIQSLAADGAALEITSETTSSVRVPSRSRRLVLGYSGMSLAVPERVRFRYLLEGFDHGWSGPVAEREAVYTNLGPGPYRFRLTASDSSGVWNNQEATLSFAVAPAWWQTWWFRTTLAVSAILAVVALYRLRLRQATASLHVRFEERFTERTRIAQELHDTLLQGFLSASLQVHAAAGKLPAESEVKPAIARSLELMRQVIDEGRDAVRGLRSAPGTPLDLESALSQLHAEMSAPAEPPVDFRVISEGRRKMLHPLLKDEVFRIGREALLNAFRHSGANKIEVALQYFPGSFHLIVRDDGRGIDAKTLSGGSDGHWGLVGMRERAERTGAKLRLLSSPGAGTEIELSVPGHIAFRD